MSITATLPHLPLPKERAQQLSGLIDGLDAVSLWWISGYAAGLASKVPYSLPTESDRATAEPAGAARAAHLAIVYGSQTGNSKGVAEALCAKAEAAGLDVRLARADAYPVKELAQEELLYVVISTQGDGEPPDDARGFMDFITGRRAPRLDRLSYAVLALGDSSYPDFCVTGHLLDDRLAELGGKRLFACGEADLDVESVSVPWTAQAIACAREVQQAQTQPAANVTPLRAPGATGVACSEAQPFSAEIIASQPLTFGDGARDVRHLEIDLAGSGIQYEPGDSLAVVPHNAGELVAEVLALLHLDGAVTVTVKEETLSLTEWLTRKRELTRNSRPFLTALAEKSGDAALKTLLEAPHADALRDWMDRQQIVDALARCPAPWSADELVAALRPLAARSYSIASSRAEVGEVVHLAVAHVEYRHGNRTRWGTASHWLATRNEGEHVEVYLDRNERFRLPRSPGTDIIMVGAGTGVAPFRAFLQERAESGANGRNWLFFGNPHFRTDFLYQVEWQAALKNGTLTRMHVAFSRDQADKVYVQRRLRENGRDLFDWLEQGAHFYVCGATAMARSAETALRDVIIEHGERSPDAADEYIAGLRAAHRYARDIY